MNNYSLFSYFSFLCKNLHIPTILTVGRFLIIPFICLSIMTHSWNKALMLFLGAAITDVLDGALARYTDAETALGAYLDPLADKCLILCSFVSLSLSKFSGFVIPNWFTIALFIKEVLLISVVGYFGMLKNSIKIRPSIWGKGANFVQSLCLFMLLGAGLAKIKMGHFLNPILFFILIISFGALIHYFWIGYKELSREH